MENFAKLIKTTKNSHSKKFIQLQMKKSSLTTDEKQKELLFRSACVFLKLGENAEKLHLMKNDYSPMKKLTKKEQITREAAKVGLSLPKVPGENNTE